MAEKPAASETKKAEKKAAAVLAKIAKMPEPFGEMGQRLHAAILRSAPELEPKWRWGLPFYRRDGKDICYFRPEAGKCMVFGFSGDAKLTRDERAPDRLLASAWFLTSLDEATEAKISAMVRKAVE